MAVSPRPRRRATKPSTAAGYDRSMDAPGGLNAGSSDGADELRTVDLDDEAPDAAEGDEFLLEQRPPHHGG